MRKERSTRLSLIGLAVLCVLVGAAGTEMLHTWKPELVKKMALPEYKVITF